VARKIKKILFEILPQANLFNMDFIKLKFNEHLSRKRDNSALFFGLCNFGIWYKKFLK